MIVRVPSAYVEKVWPSAAPHLEKATRRTRGRYLPDDVLQEIKEGWQDLWVAYDPERNVIDAAMTTQFVNYPRVRAIRILFIGGTRMNTWKDEFRVQVKEFGKDNGATLIESAGRVGWERAYPEVQRDGVMMSEEIQ